MSSGRNKPDTIETSVGSQNKQAQGPWTDLALHTLGWKAFQDLCAQVCEAILGIPVEVYREAQDGGQDAVFTRKGKPAKDTMLPATIQCKFTNKAGQRLKPSDLKIEEDHLLTLRDQGQINTYIFMTNMGVDAPVAVSIKTKLRTLGVIHPHVYGREYLTRVIRSSSRLRALVPRIYGLGDLSTILDERQAAQTKALLGHLLPTLAVYVPTKPHRDAVALLDKHGIVLLLGDPATGKSTLAAILAATACEHAGRSVYKLDGPEGLLENWNPHEPKGFYWIDDAFGPNQLREDFVDRWISVMPKIQTAVAQGNQFILTSRRHIYEAAKPKLGSRNHPLFRDEHAIINVGSLTHDERRQILYNHIKFGNQPAWWKSYLKKSVLELLAAEWRLLPEYARRLADPAFTTRVSMNAEGLLNFIKNPKAHLVQTIEELSKPHRAALTLVFLHRGHMPATAPAPEMQRLVMRHFSVDAEELGNAITQLSGSFLTQTTDNESPNWIYQHPTIADALSASLGKTAGLTELYLQGTKPETLVAEVACSGMTQLPDAIIVPSAFDDLLVERLAELPNERSLNRQLFSFLDTRASKEFLTKFVDRHPNMIARSAQLSEKLLYDPTICVRARAYSLGLLSSELREESEAFLTSALLQNADTSFLDNDEILALIRPTKLLRLTHSIRNQILSEFPQIVEGVVEDADLDIAPESNFEDVQTILEDLKEFFTDDMSVADLVEEAASSIDDGIEEVSKKKIEKEKEKETEEADGWNWRRLTPTGTLLTRVSAPPSTPSQEFRARSIFSDVDE